MHTHMLANKPWTIDTSAETTQWSVDMEMKKGPNALVKAAVSTM